MVAADILFLYFYTYTHMIRSNLAIGSGLLQRDQKQLGTVGEGRPNKPVPLLITGKSVHSPSLPRIPRSGQLHHALWLFFFFLIIFSVLYNYLKTFLYMILCYHSFFFVFSLALLRYTVMKDDGGEEGTPRRTSLHPTVRMHHYNNYYYYYFKKLDLTKESPPAADGSAFRCLAVLPLPSLIFLFFSYHPLPTTGKVAPAVPPSDVETKAAAAAGHKSTPLFDDENDRSTEGSTKARRRPRQVVYIYDDDESYSKALEPSHPEQVNNGPTSVVCCCHQEKKAVSPLNPRIGLPGPIALFGFGSTVVLANLAVAGLCDHNAFMDCMAIFHGGLVQFVCGYFELVNKNTVGCIICTGYGAYNLILGMANVLPASTGVITDNFMGGFFCVWMFYALTVFLMCVKGPIMGSVLNFMVVLNFLCNAAGNWATNTALLHFAGYEGIVLGSVAIYMGMAFSLSAAHGHNVLPLGFHDNFRNFRW
eukprot:gene8587-6027_t